MDSVQTAIEVIEYTLTEEILWFLFFYFVLLLGMIAEIWWRCRKSPDGPWPAAFKYICRWKTKVILPTALFGLGILLIWELTGFGPLIEGVKYVLQFVGAEFKEPPGDLIKEGEVNAIAGLIGFILMHLQNTKTMQKEKYHERTTEESH